MIGHLIRHVLSTRGATFSFVLAALLEPLPMQGQQYKPLGLDDAIREAERHSNALRASQARTDRSARIVTSAIDIPKTEVFYSYDANNIAPNNLPLKVWGINQSIQFPTVYSAQKRVLEQNAVLSRQQYALDKMRLDKELAKAFYEIVYWRQLRGAYAYLDSLYRLAFREASGQLNRGEISYLETLALAKKEQETAMQTRQADEQLEKARLNFNAWIQSDTAYTADTNDMPKLKVEPWDSAAHPGMIYYANLNQLSQRTLTLEKRKLWPDLNFSFFQGNNNGEHAQAFNGFLVGVALPLWFGDQRAKIHAAYTDLTISELERRNYVVRLIAKRNMLMADFRRLAESVSYYEGTGKKLASAMASHAAKALSDGEINYISYIELLADAKSTDIAYLSTLFEYDMTTLEINYIAD